MESNVTSAGQGNRCISCGEAKFRVAYRVTDTNQGVPGSWDMRICETCGLGVIDPLPTDDEVSSFYIDQFYSEEGKRFQYWIEYIRSMLAWLRGIDLNRMISRRGRLLDFGAGAGHFAKAQIKKGWEVYSIDPYSSIANSSDRCRTKNGCLGLDFPDNYFDVITLWYVVEHLRDPVQVIEELTRVLKKDGMLVLAQQDFKSIQARVFGPRWLILDPPRHIWQFSEDNLLRLLTPHGYSKAFVSHSSIELGPFTILQSILNCLTGNKNYLFNLLKNGALRSKLSNQDIPAIYGISSILLGVLLFPASILLYFLLLIVGSGDVFTIYVSRAEQS